MNSCWFRATDIWGRNARVFDGAGKPLILVAEYDPISRTVKSYVRENGNRLRIQKDENGKPVTKTEVLPESYIIVAGIRY